MTRMQLAGCACLALAGLTQAAAQSGGAGDLSVTIYNNDLALVQDVRQLNIPTGRSVQSFPGVSGQIRSETVSFAAADAGIVEQNFDYDLLSPQSLMQKAVGQTVTIVRINPATGAETSQRAKVLAANGGVVLQIGERIEVLRDDSLPTRVIFDGVPPNLRARPTLSVTLDSTRAGTRPASLSYLTSGMGWSADYVALFDSNAGKIDVQGWITLNNRSGTSYDNARTLLVAGNPSGGDNSYDRSGGYRPTSRGSLRSAGTESADRESLGDFYLYPLTERTTIANAQTKQVSFLDVTGAPAQNSYEFTVGGFADIETPQSASSVLLFKTSRDGGLGDALPAGTVRVYMRDRSGQPQFIGENRIDHTPMGSELGLRTGEAFDVKVKTLVEKREEISEQKWEETARFRWTGPEGTTTGTSETLRKETYYQTTMRYTISNAGSRPVTVNLRQDGLNYWYDRTRIVAETIKGERISQGSMRWTVPVAANSSTDLVVTFVTR